ncbi:MAG TPA: quinolinate synthase NadA [Candidatus Altiarchaeales archaeon]|nr:quinolinate synthase NadA [Candidatus Altiarchaeales archaeon]
MVKTEEIVKKIQKLKEKRNAVILAHNYQRPEIQDIADFVGDSLDLSRKAKESDAEVIVFCGVYFMAEVAKVLCPEKVVLIPDLGAKCTMALMLPPEVLKEAKRKNPEAKVVSYINSTSAIKAESDYICTSSNAVEVVKKVDSRQIIFTPDVNLAHYIQKEVRDKSIRAVPTYGSCPVHNLLSLEDLKKIIEKHKDAEIVAHPETRPEIQEVADYIASTNGIVKYCKRSKSKKFIICTEEGLIYRLKKEIPDKEFILASKYMVCSSMKVITLEKVLMALEKMKYEVKLHATEIEKIRRAIEFMINLKNDE